MSVFGILADCKSIRYEQGGYEGFQGVKSGYRDSFSDGAKYTNRGYGHGSKITPSKLVLTVSICDEDNKGNNNEEVLVDKFFKEKFGRLTENRRNSIISTMPCSVYLEAREKRDGSIYYILSDDDLMFWYKRACEV